MVHPGEDETISMQSGAGARLTARERTVLAVSATGLVASEVAEVLDLTPDVVRGELTSAVAKLGVRSKLEAVVVALRAGVIDSSMW